MRRVFITLTICCLLFPLTAFLVEKKQVEVDQSAQVLNQAYILHKQVDWQTYEFWVKTNLEDNSDLKYFWNIDDQDFYQLDKVKYYFDKGQHIISVNVSDENGQVIQNSTKIKVWFWSFNNNWFLWLLYVIIVFIILYYWVIKIIYLINRRKVNKHVRKFLDVLDEHGFVDQLIKNIGKSSKSKRGRARPSKFK